MLSFTIFLVNKENIVCDITILPGVEVARLTDKGLSLTGRQTPYRDDTHLYTGQR